MAGADSPPLPHTEGLQTFNNDIAVNADDKERIQRLFPGLAPFLIFPEMHDIFLRHDALANAAKRRGRFFGVLAILLAMAALIAASGAPYLHDFPAVERALAGIGAALGIAGVILGLFGGLHTGAKRAWLWNRVMTERLRQFQFQSLALHAAEIARAMGNSKAMRRLLDERLRWFERFRHHHEGQLPAQLAGIISDENGERVWTVDRPEAAEPLSDADNANLERIFDAYRLLRFEHQIRYCNYKLRDPGGISPETLRGLSVALAFAAFACIGLTFFIHVVVALGSTIGVAKSAAPALHFAAVALAMAALGVRAFEEGLRPRHEIERYLRYRADMSKLLARFRAADVAGKLALMHEAEEVSYEEMRDFLRTHDEALFVL
jgi:hypothetical protein